MSRFPGLASDVLHVLHKARLQGDSLCWGPFGWKMDLHGLPETGWLQASFEYVHREAPLRENACAWEKQADRMLSHLLHLSIDCWRFALDRERSLAPMLICAFLFSSSLWGGRNIIMPLSISYALKWWALLNPHEDHWGNSYIMQLLQCKMVSI